MCHVTQTKTLLGPRIILIDDLEGFDETYITATVKLIKNHATGEDSSIVITTSDMYDRRLVALRNISTLERLRMFAPSSKHATAAVRSISNASTALIETLARQTFGNYHQLLLRLRMHIASEPDAHVNIFKTTESLLKKEVTVELWMRSAEASTLVSLLHETPRDKCIGW